MLIAGLSRPTEGKNQEEASHPRAPFCNASTASHGVLLHEEDLASPALPTIWKHS